MTLGKDQAMKANPNQPADAAELRRRAEQRLQTRQRTPQSAIRNSQSAIPNPQSTPRLVHELQVHQIELEMQNEELQRARARAEALLAQYTDLYDFAPVGYLTLNEPGLIQEANLTAAKLLGVARSQLRQRPLSRFILREDADIYDRHRRQLFETRAPQSCELRMKRPGATPFWVRLEASVPTGSGVAAPVCRATLSDITRHKQAEADRERAAQFERLAQLMKCASDVILLTDEHGRILEANDRALETYGYSLAELRQKTVADLRTPESRAELPHQAEQLETDGRAVYEAMNQRRDGVVFPVEISARFLQIAGVRYRLGIVRDITERKRAQEALRESELFARSVLNSLTAHIAVLDAQGVIVAVNEAWKLFARENGGAETNAYLGVNYLAVCEESLRRGKDEAVAAALRGLRAVMKGKQSEFSLDYPCHSPGEQRWFILRATRFPGEGPVQLVVAHENITQRKQADRELRESEEKFAAAFHASPNLMSITRIADGTILEVNEGYSRLLGYARGESIGKTTADLSIWVDPADRATFVARLTHLPPSRPSY